jgi:hypothetical protein
MKKLLFLYLFTLLICDPYTGDGTITNVQIQYSLNNTQVTQTGQYTVYGDYIKLYEYNGSTSGWSNIKARWSNDNGTTWSSWTTSPRADGFGF